MRECFFVVIMLALSGCGYDHRDSEMIGQIKKVQTVTPLVCPDQVRVDVSLGVLRNGVGSMSTEDVELRVINQSDVEKLKTIAERGAIARIRYDQKRVTICYPMKQVRWVDEIR